MRRISPWLASFSVFLSPSRHHLQFVVGGIGLTLLWKVQGLWGMLVTGVVLKMWCTPPAGVRQPPGDILESWLYLFHYSKLGPLRTRAA